MWLIALCGISEPLAFKRKYDQIECLAIPRKSKLKESWDERTCDV